MARLPASVDALSHDAPCASSQLTYDTFGAPFMVDWCVLDVRDEDGAMRRVEVAHADPAQEGLARTLMANTAEPEGDPDDLPLEDVERVPRPLERVDRRYST